MELRELQYRREFNFKTKEIIMETKQTKTFCERCELMMCDKCQADM